jgi:tRNA pseudouridine55 synthase
MQRFNDATNEMNEDGILLIDKPAGLTSAQVVAAVKRRFRFNKVGHGGTLDPGATGLLALLIGKGTSLSNAVMGGDKVYTGEILVGTETTTQDTEGEIVAELPYDLVTEERLREQMANLRGDIYQTPPMVSAIKINGVPLYKLARKGETVAREPRLIHVYDFRLLSYDAPVGRFEVMCGKGTYVRTLCHDVGKALGCGACMKSLRRIASGKLRIEDAITLAAVLAMDRETLLARIIPCYRYAGSR